MSKLLEVRQKEYSIIAENSNYQGFLTKGIFTCTAVFGLDKNSGVAFLAHFDTPETAKSILRIIEEASNLAGSSASFELEIINANKLIGFLCLLNPFRTRCKLFKYIAQSKCANIKNDYGFNYWFIKKDVIFNKPIKNILLINRWNIFTDKRYKKLRGSKTMTKTPGSN